MIGKILIIQTAFPGDVILATPVAEKLRRFFPESDIHFLVRKGNEGLPENSRAINRVITWEKRSRKYRNLLKLVRIVRKEKYDLVVNLQRFFSTGLLTVLSGAKQTVGFSKNPLSVFFSRQLKHSFSSGLHEAERNVSLIAHITDSASEKPKLYPSIEDDTATAVYKQRPYVCLAPASVWFTKQFPPERWTELIVRLPEHLAVYLIGGKPDAALCDKIIEIAGHVRYIVNLAGTLSFLESASLMRDAVMNYTNDSAPLHIASAVNAPVRAVFCSTVPSFGFGPLSDDGGVVQIDYSLYCRPCGIHGKRHCPEGHFKCANDIRINDLLIR